MPGALRVFISSTTDDLDHCRRGVAEAIRSLGHEPVIQDTLAPDSRNLPALLEAKIRDCHLVIVLVGFSYGRPVPAPNPYAGLLPAGWGGCSYTQLEFFLATHWRKQFFLLFVIEGSSLDVAAKDELREHQILYREYIRKNHRQVRQPIRNLDDAITAVRHIEFDSLHTEARPWPEECRFSPYKLVLPPMFLGRTQLLRDLESAVARQESISLVGDTRSGKTSLLRTWEQRATAFCRRIHYVNGHDRAGQNAAAFVREVTGMAAPASADGAADALARWANAKPDPPLVLVDEGDTLIRQAPVRFFERLRGLVGQRAIMLVMATRRDLATAFQDFQQTGSPFGNIMQTLRIALLEPHEADLLAARAGGYATLLRDWSGEHPYFLQLAGWHLERTFDTDRALTAFRDEAYIRLKEIWAGLSFAERSALVDSLEGKPVPNFKLGRRGLQRADGRPFGRVLVEWWRDDPQSPAK